MYNNTKKQSKKVALASTSNLFAVLPKMWLDIWNTSVKETLLFSQKRTTLWLLWKEVHGQLLSNTATSMLFQNVYLSHQVLLRDVKNRTTQMNDMFWNKSCKIYQKSTASRSTTILGMSSLRYYITTFLQRLDRRTEYYIDRRYCW